jgi:starch synthase
MGNAATSARTHSHTRIPASVYPPLHLESLQPQRKRILFVTSELTDLIKVGGLGDVSAALPRALSAQHDIRVLIPGYRQILESGRTLRIVGQIEGLAALPACKIGRLDLSDGLPVYVLLHPALFDREGSPYGDQQGRDWPDNHIRFASLSLAAAEIARGSAGINWRPELVHANDWPAAMTPAYMTWRRIKTPTLLTIHNLAYQGLCDMQCSAELAIPEHARGIDGMEFHGRLSFLKAGILYANHVTTVSRTYAQEITTPGFGCGLEGMLRVKVEAGRLSGIINGIDESWEPANDPHLIQGFSAEQWQGKRANTTYVEKMFGLQSEGPLFAVVSRLVQQKGIDLTLQVADQIVANGGRLAVMGRGEAELERAMEQLATRYPGRVGVHIGFNETDARRVFAGSDFLLMPSRFEPCGLSQMYAQRFASLPIARRTGGLADTIEDGVTGFLFNDSSLESYQAAVQRAFSTYKHPELLNAMRCRAMKAPLFWQQSVKPYDRLYQQLLSGVQVVAAESP